MKRSSWIAIGISSLLIAGLIAAYFASQGGHETLTQEDAIQTTKKLEEAFRNKSVGAVMDHLGTGSDTRISDIGADQLRMMLANYFRNSDHLHADLSNYTFSTVGLEGMLQFDATLFNNSGDSVKEDYHGHITLHFRRVVVPHLFGMYKTKEWRIVGVDTTGPNLSGMGEY